MVSEQAVPVDPRRMRELVGPPDGLEQLRAELHRLEVAGDVLRAAGVESPMQHNPSVVVHDGQLVACVRVNTGGVSDARNFLGTVANDGTLEDQREMRDLVREPARYVHTRSYGYEDVRLFVRGGRLCASADVCDRVQGDASPKMAVLDLDDEGSVVACHVQPSDRYEKNWMPVVDAGELRFVYGVEPVSLVVTYDDATHRVRPEASRMPRTPATLRGGSQLLPWNGCGYLAVVHQVHAGRPTYVHRFVRFDRMLQVQRIGAPFYFRELGIEFCAGIAHHAGAVVLSFGVRDREAWLALVDVDDVERWLQ